MYAFSYELHRTDRHRDEKKKVETQFSVRCKFEQLTQAFNKLFKHHKLPSSTGEVRTIVNNCEKGRREEDGVKEKLRSICEVK